MKNKRANTQVAIHDIIADRWSPRAFDADKKVSEKALLAMLEAARWAPSCFNDQPWRYVVFDKSKDETVWRNALMVLAEKNQLWAKNAPLLILTVAANNFSHNGNANRWSQYDTGAATLNLILQAETLGLVAHQMGGFDVEKAHIAFDVPKDYTLMSMVAVGYQGDENILSDDFKQAEGEDRSRSGINNIVFHGAWGKGEA